MPEISSLVVAVRADTSDAERGLNSLNAKVGGVGSAIQTAFGTAAVGAIGGLAAGLGASVTAAAGFESTMSGVKAVSGATADELANLSALALDLGAKTSYSAAEAGRGIEELVKGGLSIPDIMGGAAEATLALAAAGGVSLPDAATIAANALAQFNLKGEDMARVADLIAGAANASALDVGQFKYSLQAAGAVAATVGFGFDDLATAIAVMGKAGITGSDAGTSLKTMMLNLQPTTKEQKKLFRELGLTLADGSNAFFDATGKVKSMADVAGILQGALGGMTEQQRLATLETIFGSDAIRAGAVLAKEGAGGFEAMAASMGKVTAATVGAEKLDNLSGSLEQLKGSLETAAIGVGLQFLPSLKGLADTATGLVNGAMPGLAAMATSLAGAFEAAGPIVGRFFGFLSEHRATIAAVVAGLGSFAVLLTVAGWIGAAATALSTLVATIGGASGIVAGIVAVLGGPLTIALGALAAAVGVFTAAWLNNWGGIQERVAAVWQAIKPIFAELVAIVQQALGGDIAGAFERFKALVGEVAATLGPILAGWGREFVAWIGPMATEAMAALGGFAQRVVAWLAENVPKLTAQLATWATAFVQWIGPMIPLVLTALGGLVVGLVEWVGTNAGPILDSLGAWARNFVAWVGPTIPPLLAALGTLLSDLVGWVAGTALPAIAAKLVEWGTAFSAWIGPAATEALTQLGVMLGQFTVWLANTGLPAIETELVKWRAAMSKWIDDSGPDVAKALGGLLLIVLGAMATWPQQVMDAGVKIGGGLVEGMIRGAEGGRGELVQALQNIIASALRTAWNGARAMVPGLRAAGDLFEPGPQRGRIVAEPSGPLEPPPWQPEIPLPRGAIDAYAQGGPILGPTLLSSLSTGRPYAIAGEAGPEVVAPIGGRGGGATYVTVNVTQPLGSPQSIAEAVREALSTLDRQGRLAVPV